MQKPAGIRFQRALLFVKDGQRFSSKAPNHYSF
jgi:hypothetical protein